MSTMNKLRWAMDGGFWDVDISTPVTLEGEARAVPGHPLPLGVSRGTRLSRPKQIDFFQRFMFAPFLPSYSYSSASTTHTLSLQRGLTIPLTQNWFAALQGQFNLHKFVSSLRKFRGLVQPSDSPSSSLFPAIGACLRDKSLYALGISTEVSLTPQDTLLLSSDASGGDDTTPRHKAVFQHEFPHHNLTMEAVSPALFLDKTGNYWDVPLSLALDLASIPSKSGASYHFCMRHIAGLPKLFQGGDHTRGGIPATLLPGTTVRHAMSLKKNVEIWRSQVKKLKMVQPFDIFLCNPHVSASGVIGAAVTASHGENSVGSELNDLENTSGFSYKSPALKSAVHADMFSSVSFVAQHGSFQKWFLDLTRFQARFDFPSGRKFLTGASQLAHDFVNSQQPTMTTIEAICPNATISLQQQIVGPFSFRVDSEVNVKLENKRNWEVHAHDTVFAIEYALQVLGSAKAIAWYAPKQREFMVELRFFET
ncbi:Protein TRIGALACTOSYLDIACYLGLYCEROL 4, chloroplastic [Linum grandiflorum]